VRRHNLREHNGEQYLTISDLAKHFDVASKTVRDWANKGIIPEPEILEKGLTTTQVYLETSLPALEEAIKRHRDNKKRGTRGR
jgi:hypothetical protein